MFILVKNGKKYQVVKALDNTVVCDLEDPSELLTFQGGEVKAVGDDGKFEGYAILFTDKDNPDLLGDYFTKATDFFFDGKESFDVPFLLYHHAQNPVMKARRIGTNVKAVIDEVGVFVTGELNRRDKYEKAIYEKLLKKKKLGFSTGSAPHLVSRKSLGDVDEITAWPIIELSLTPTPVEPGTSARVASIKSLIEEVGDGSLDEIKSFADEPEDETKSLYQRLNEFIEDSVDEGRSRAFILKSIAYRGLCPVEKIEMILKGRIDPNRAELKGFAKALGIDFEYLQGLAKSRDTDVSVKGIFEDQLAEDEYKTWDLWNAFCKVVSKIAAAAVAAPLAGASDFKWDKLVDEAIGEYSARLQTVVKKQITDYLEGENTDYKFYLRALGDPTSEDFVQCENVSLEDHCSLAVSALKSVEERVFKSHAARVQETKAGRVLAEKYQKQYRLMLDGITTKVKEGYKFLDSLKPKSESSGEGESVKAQVEANRNRLRLLEL
jgi:hypothetical protein